MKFNVGIDVGGTFTDFLVTAEGREPVIHKVLSTPGDPSVGVLEGLEGIAAIFDMTLLDFARAIETIVHGTTITTNAVLTEGGARTGLLTTRGVRDALEMRRGIREKQYDNRYTNVRPLVPRYLRRPVGGRLNYCGEELETLELEDVRQAVGLFKSEDIETIAICFMNSFANPEHEQQAARLVREEFPGAYLTVSSELLPSIRFYDRLSTAVLNAYVGPKLNTYIEQLKARLREINFDSTLLIMQSNGGVMSPEIAQTSPARTLLSGPAAGPGAAVHYLRPHGQDSCITVDMGGTSFDATLVRDGVPVVVTDGEINRQRIALPMLDIVTIGAGGGSIGWMDEGGLLRMGPQSAGADPGPACYNTGGTLPTCTDADLVLGYLNAEFFAGGKIKLDRAAAVDAITQHIAQPLGMTVEQAAAGMCRVINTNMAEGVREITIKRGFDPREFPMVAAGGAGPLHACMICRELDMSMFIVPGESSILCAAGMLMSDLQHDLVVSFVAELDQIAWDQLNEKVENMLQQGTTLLVDERIPDNRRNFSVKLDCRYVKQYHEVSFPVPIELLRHGDRDAIATCFHAEHQRLYGYSLEREDTPIELINIRLRATGQTRKPSFSEQPYTGSDPTAALKGERNVYIPERNCFMRVPVYDGHKTRHGNRIKGPALIEQINTTLLLTESFTCVCDQYGSFVAHVKGQEELLHESVQEAST